MKKAQVTVFIIIGVVILLTIFLVFLFREKIFYKKEMVKFAELSGYPEEFKIVAENIDDCIQSVSKEGKNLIMLQGGYFLPELYLFKNELKIAYWYYKDKDISPNLITFQSEISKYIEFALPLCIENIWDTNNVVIATETKPISNVKIKNNSIEIKIKYPVTVKRGNLSATLEEFTASLETNLTDILIEAKEILNEITKTGYIDTTELMSKETHGGMFSDPDTNATIIYITRGDETLMFGIKE